jgi:hypothetical protein
MSLEENPVTNDTPQVLLEHHLKQLRLPTSCASTTKWRDSAPPRAWTIRATCCV